MNLGLWPANNILEAQTNLTKKILQKLNEIKSNPRGILELGSGWGGSRSLIHDIFGKNEYFGLNCSEDQMAYAKMINAHIPNTKYINGYIENLCDLNITGCEALVAIESLLHVKDKERVLLNCRPIGIRYIAIADICIEDASLISAYPLFNPSLNYAWSSEKYLNHFKFSGYEDFEIVDITTQVFSGWSNALEKIEIQSFTGNRKVLKQFQKSYFYLYKLSEKKLVKYIIIIAKVKSAV
jgi:hypothetical protein